MKTKVELWEARRQNGERALEEARYLYDADMFAGAAIRALGSCLQVATSATDRLREENDPEDLVACLKVMIRTKRLPMDILDPFMTIVRAHSEELVTGKETAKDRAEQAISMAVTFHRLMDMSADLSISVRRPKVKAAMAARGIPMPF